MVKFVTGNFQLNLGADAFLLNTANIYLQCKTGSGAVNIILPRISTLQGVTTTWGFKIYINDVDNNAQVNNITITPHPADKINGVLSAPFVLSSKGVTGHLQVTGTNAWEFSVDTSGGGSGIPYGNDTGIPNAVQVAIPNATLTAGYTFEVRIKTGNTNTGASTLQINALGVKALVDTDLNPLIAGMMVGDSIYLFAYNLEIDKYELLGLAKPSLSPFESGTGANSAQLVGSGSLANGAESVAEGSSTTANGTGSHSEGQSTTASGDGSHAEGEGTTAFGNGSHTEGAATQASANFSHAEGASSLAGNVPDSFSIPAGGVTVTISGDVTSKFDDGDSVYIFSLNGSGTPTFKTIVSPPTFGGTDTTFDIDSPVDVDSTSGSIVDVNKGIASHAEGEGTVASGTASHSEGQATTASGTSSHAEGTASQASASVSHAEGQATTASGGASHAEGVASQASGNVSHAEGLATTASGVISHAEGQATTASGTASHSEGQGTVASGTASHAEGVASEAISDNSHAGGLQSKASRVSEQALADGQFNQVGDAQSCTNHYKEITDDDSPTTLRDSNGGTFVLGDNANNISAIASFKIQLTGVETGTSGNGFTAHIEGAVKNTNGTMSFVGVPTINVYADPFAISDGWNVNVLVDDGTSSLLIVVNGGSSGQVSWVAKLETVETLFTTQ